MQTKLEVVRPHPGPLPPGRGGNVVRPQPICERNFQIQRSENLIWKYGGKGRWLILDMKIAIGSDHAGFEYKGKIIAFLQTLGHEVKDMGTNSNEPVDYPLFIRPVAEAVARGEYERGVVLGGSGNGEAMVANRVKGVRCALCWNIDSARLGRQHNNANVISIGQRMMPPEMALDIVKTWLDTPFEGGRHQRRIDEIDA
jgi:ribose 5-phosphate isomerase B